MVIVKYCFSVISLDEILRNDKF